MVAAVFLALSLKAFLALEHKTPIIDDAHKALIGSCWTPKSWKKPPTLNLITESPAAIHRCTASLRGTLFRIGSVDNYRKHGASFILSKRTKLQSETGTLVRPLETAREQWP